MRCDKVLNNTGPLVLIHLGTVDFGHFVNGLFPLTLGKERLHHDVTRRMAAHAHDKVVITARGNRKLRFEMRQRYRVNVLSAHG
jgi:hypothetical protein